jgi:predicted DNA-binding protein
MWLMAKKSQAKTKRADQFMLRLPDGMRDELATLAEANGLSMNAEIVEAIERHLQGADRIAQVWEFFERHRKDIEGIALVRAAVENLEIFAERSGEFRGGLRELRRHQEP